MNSLDKPYSEIESKKGDKENKIEVMVKILFEKKNDEIYQVYEISDNRLAIELDKCVKIYSLKNFKLLTEINHERVDNSMELKNKDMVILKYNILNFYKLSENNYVFYQKISEEKKFLKYMN